VGSRLTDSRPFDRPAALEGLMTSLPCSRRRIQMDVSDATLPELRPVRMGMAVREGKRAPSDELVCGGCGQTIAVVARAEEWTAVIFRCLSCDAKNRVAGL